MGESLPSDGAEPRGEADDRASSFGALADHELESSYRLARVIMGSRYEAEDAVHDAFETAWCKWHTLRDPSRFEAWFRRILVNTCRDRLRKSSRRREHDIAAARSPLAPDDLGPVVERERISQAFAALDADHRIVLALRYYRDLAVDDIARLLEVRPGTVKSRLHRAQERMREILAAQGMPR